MACCHLCAIFRTIIFQIDEQHASSIKLNNDLNRYSIFFERKLDKSLIADTVIQGATCEPF